MPAVLLGFDGSAPSRRALTQAVHLAQVMGARLEVVHALAPILLAPSTYSQAVADIERKERDEGARLLAEAVAEATAAGVTARGTCQLGTPAELLLDLAASDEVKALVVGSRGRGAVARVLLGSVADQIVKASPKPVLVVR